MHLASASDPNGSRSKSHFIVLHHVDQSDLVKLPYSYSDLEKEVRNLYGAGPGRFFVETDSLNLCRGKRVRIPANLWGEISELIGDVHIVRCDDDKETQHRPELASPESVFASEPPSSVLVPPNSQIPLNNEPVKDNEPANSFRKDVLYEQILACEPKDSRLISQSLAVIREGGSSDSDPISTADIKWRQQRLNNKWWTGFNWSLHPKSVFLIRFNDPKRKADATSCQITFLRNSQVSLRIKLYVNSRAVSFSEHDDSGTWKDYHSVTLSNSVFSPGEHTIAIVHHDGQVHIIFDFSTRVVLPRNTFLTRGPHTSSYQMGLLDFVDYVDVEMYHFGQ